MSEWINDHDWQEIDNPVRAFLIAPGRPNNKGAKQQIDDNMGNDEPSTL